MPLASPLTDNMQGWGTAAGALVAVFAVVAAVLAYRGQNRQLRLQQQQIADQQELNRRQGEVLELQAQELRESIGDRQRVVINQRRALAIQASFELSHSAHENGWHTWSATVLNDGPLPIYEADIHFRQADATWNPGPYLELTHNGFGPNKRLSPHARAIWTAKLLPGSDIDPDSVTAYTQFRDANEVWWRIKPDGRIQEIVPPDWS